MRRLDIHTRLLVFLAVCFCSSSGVSQLHLLLFNKPELKSTGIMGSISQSADISNSRIALGLQGTVKARFKNTLIGSVTMTKWNKSKSDFSVEPGNVNWEGHLSFMPFGSDEFRYGFFAGFNQGNRITKTRGVRFQSAETGIVYNAARVDDPSNTDKKFAFRSSLPLVKVGFTMFSFDDDAKSMQEYFFFCQFTTAPKDQTYTTDVSLNGVNLPEKYTIDGLSSNRSGFGLGYHLYSLNLIQFGTEIGFRPFVFATSQVEKTFKESLYFNVSLGIRVF